MNRLVFVTTELHPETAGGAGVVVDSLVRKLEGTRPHVVVLLSPSDIEVASRSDVEVVTAHIPPSDFVARSNAAAGALRGLIEPDDRIEFHDFEGIGFWALARRQELGLGHNPITVRFHGPYDLISEVLDDVPADWEMPRVMEAETYRMADEVLVPVVGWEEVLVDRYNLSPERIRLSPPPVDGFGQVGSSGSSQTFAVIGRLGEVKGSHDMVAAAVSLLKEDYELSVRFVGGEGWSASASLPMSDWLRSMIPDEYADRFEFVAHTPRHELPDALKGVTAVVVPSRFESFCLAAHEARSASLPVIVPDLPAFSGLFGPETGAIVYEPGVPGLVDAMRSALDNPGLTDDLAIRSRPNTGDPLEAYRSDPSPRHPRSQAGLATAATQRLEQATESAHKPTSVLQSLYRFLPTKLARVASKVVPDPVKKRAKGAASWPAEQARRDRENRLAAVQSRIDAGEFPEIGSPDVSVVIPVYNDTRFLDETLASVYEQTHGSWEIIVVDDGSTDPGCVETLDGLDRSRLRVIHQENKGLPDARNTGIAQARGRFVVPLDSDDELQPSYLERMLPALEANPGVGFAHCYARLYHDIDAVWMTRPFNPYWQLMENGVVGCVLLRREAWKQAGGYDKTMTNGNEDWELWVRLIANGWEQVQIPEVLFKYRKHGVSMSVATESAFEDARRGLRDRHPGLYDSTALREMKRQHYPLVTVLIDRLPDPEEDIEFINSEDELATSWGKFVVDARGFSPFPTTAIRKLAANLEDNPKAARAITSGDPPLVAIRRWNLHDEWATASAEMTLADETAGPRSSLPSLVPRPLWAPPPSLGEPGLPLQRQRPEEAGYLPDPESW